MKKINCNNCSFVTFTESDGVECGYLGISYLDEKIDTDYGFCKEFKYDHCMECEFDNYDDISECINCNKWGDCK